MADLRNPKEVLVSTYHPGRKLAKFSVKIKNAPGAIAEVSKTLAKMGVNILLGFHIANPAEEEARWSFFVDLTGLDAKPEELVKQVKGLGAVLEVSVTEAKFDGLIIDDSFPLLASGERSLVLRVETWGEIYGRLLEKFGSGAGVILYEMGVSAGENKAQWVVERYGVNGLNALQIILAERTAKGWGIPNLAGFNEKKFEATIKVQDLFECLPFKGKHKEAKSHFFRGYLTGAFKKLFNKEVATTEVECVAKGDLNCKFIIK